jgi:hypothetical protein
LTIPIGQTISETRTVTEMAIYRTAYFADIPNTTVSLPRTKDQNSFITTTLTRSVTHTQAKNNIVITGNIIPSSSATNYYLGEAGREWGNIFAKNGYFSNDLQLKNAIVSTSDKNAKKDIDILPPIYETVFDELKPVKFKFIENQSDRYHTGFIAQDVKSAVEHAGLTTQDFAAYCEWTNEDGCITCGIRYEELISLCVDQIQKLKKRVAELETAQNDYSSSNIED